MEYPPPTSLKGGGGTEQWDSLFNKYNNLCTTCFFIETTVTLQPPIK